MPNILAAFKPRPTLSDQERASGLRLMTWQIVSGSAADGFASAGFLAAFALLLGASNLQIGIMTAVPFIVQPLQIIAVIVVERLKVRKVIAVSSYLVAYLTWVPVALIPFFIDVPNPGAVLVLLVMVAARGAANAFLNTSWNGWLRDMVPHDIMGGFFANRLRVATIAAAVAGLAAALYVDYWKGAVAEEDLAFGYAYAMLFGSILLGWSAVGFMFRIPEPGMMALEGPRPSLRRILAAPLGDGNFRPLMSFLFLWNLAVHLAVPFFTVYMLTVLDMSVSAVVGLGVLSQVSNVLFLRLWGRMVDHLGSKIVLSVTSSLYLLVILGWAFTTMPDRYALTVPLLVVLHGFLGIASAGINVSSTTMRMKMAPAAQSTAYLTGASLAASLGAGIGPLLGGAFADFFSVRHFRVNLEWVDPTRTIDFPAVYLTGFDFLFAVAFLFGVLTMNALARVREQGEVDQSTLMNELMSQTRDRMRTVSSIPGLGFVSHFPYRHLRYVPRIPGLEVAVGLTAYELADSTRAAVVAVTRGHQTAMGLAGRVSHAISSTIHQLEDLGKHGGTAALYATRGAMHAVHDMSLELGHVTSQAVIGAVTALSKTSANPLDVLWGIGYGTIQGADEAGADLTEVAIHAVETVREISSELGVSESEAASATARGIVDATKDLRVESASRVRETVLNTFLDIASSTDDRENLME